MKLPFEVDLTGEVAVITGGGGILGADFSKAIAACGASVAVLDINLAAAEEVAKAIREVGHKAIAVKADCLSRESLGQAQDLVRKEFGACTILVNGAGGNNPRGTTDDEQYNPDVEGMKTFFDLDADGMKFVMDLNVTAALLTTQVFAEDMAGDKEVNGNIINISSMNAFRPLTKIPAYSAAKSAVSNFTQWLAVYFAKAGVRVNALAPGFFVTNQNRDLLFAEDGSPTARTGKILAATPMGRFGEAEELIGTLLWLLSEPASSFVTGVVIPVDGGFSAYSGV